MKTRFQWIAGSGIVVGIIVLLMGAGTIEDSGIFQSLKLGGKTNLISDDGAALTYNGTHYQISSATLTNASTNAFTGAGLIVLQTAVPANQTNATLVSLGGMTATAALTNLNEGIGTGLTNLLASAVQAEQTNVAAANPTATVSTSAVNGTAGTFMRSDASPAIPAAFIQANQTNDGTGNWTVNAGTNSVQTSGHVGVGTTTLPNLLTVGIGSSSDTSINPTLRVQGYNIFDGTHYYGDYGGILFGANGDFTGNARRFLIANAVGLSSFGIIRSVNATTDPTIGTAGAISSGTLDFTIDKAGNVGIGTNAPSENLEVLGNIKATGYIKLGTNILSFTGTNLYFNGGLVNVTY